MAKKSVKKSTFTTSKDVQKEKQTNIILTVLGIIVLVIIAIILFRLTYAFFTASLEDKNPNSVDAQILTADLQVRYQDGDASIELSSLIEPSDIVTKEFSVINEGNDTGLYKIVLQNYENHFNRARGEDESLESDFNYKLFLIDSLGNESVIATGTLPYSEMPIELEIDSYEEVLVSTTNKYRLEIEYINFTHIDQSDDMGKNLKALINILNVDDEKRVAPTN